MNAVAETLFLCTNIQVKERKIEMNKKIHFIAWVYKTDVGYKYLKGYWSNWLSTDSPLQQ